MPWKSTSAPSASLRIPAAIAVGSRGSSRNATTPRRTPIAPPLTGGITASSSPSFRGSSQPAYSEFTAHRNERGSGPRSYCVLSWLQASAAVAAAGGARSLLGPPAHKRGLAQRVIAAVVAATLRRPVGGRLVPYHHDPEC